jgi:hypothetical protein
MNASKLFAAVAAVVFAGSAFAADTVAANATVTTTAAAAQVSVAAQSVPAVATKAPGANRAQIRAEAVEAAKNHRSSEASQYDWINN